MKIGGPDQLPTYRVRDWAVYYETAESRRLKSMSWVPTPTKHDGRGIRRVMRHDPTGAIYGAWCLIVQVAAKCPIRGTLADADGPLTALDIADKTGLDERSVEAAIAVCLSAEIKWLETVPPDESASLATPGNTPPTNGHATRTPSSHPAMPSDSPDAVSTMPGMPGEPLEGPVLHNRTLQNRTTTTTTDSHPSWGEDVVVVMRELGVVRITAAVKDGKRNGYTPDQALEIAEYLRKCGKCPDPAGYLVGRLANIDARDLKFDEGWQWSNSAEPSSPYDVPSDVQQEDAKRLEAEALERKRKHIANVERREQMYGEQLNAMSFADHMVLIGTAPPANRELLTRDYQAKGRDSPDVRPELLRLLEAVEQKNGLAVAS